MAKKKETKAEVEQLDVKSTNEMKEVVIKKPQPKKPEWEAVSYTHLTLPTKA